MSGHIYSVVKESVQPNASRIKCLFRLRAVAASLQPNSNIRHPHHCPKLIDCVMVPVFIIFVSLLRYLLKFWLRLIIIDAFFVT